MALSDVHLRYVDATHCQVIADPGIIMELADAFTWYAPSFKYDRRYKMGSWDGKISQVNRLTGKVYSGLAHRIKKFCDSRDYTFSFDDDLCYENVSEHELKEFISRLKIPSKFEFRDYQFKSILKCLRSNRRTLVSPTSSGKSLMIYIIMRWYQELYDLKPLVIVPSIQLVKQLDADFRDYGYTGVGHLSTDGLSNSFDIDADYVCTTWQSLNNGKTKKPKQWYDQFGVVFGDEAHGAKAKSLIQILSSMTSCKYRFGTTGTLQEDPLTESTIEGLFGAKYKAVTTKELMSDGHVSKLKIKCIVLNYPEHKKKAARGLSYHDEINFIIQDKERLNFIKNLTLSLKGNRLVFFKMIEHGKDLYEALQGSPDPVFYVDGSVSGDDREDFKKQIEEAETSILLASLGTTSTGVSIRRLHKMIAASPSKSKIKVLQSIGRMLRQHETKTEAVLYDIVDNLQYKSRPNYTLNHFRERVKIYDAEGFDYELYNVSIK